MPLYGEAIRMMNYIEDVSIILRRAGVCSSCFVHNWRPGAASRSVKLQRPARAAVCSHSQGDATSSVVHIL